MASIAFDWDGVISRDPEWRPEYREVDTTLIHEAHHRGLAVVIMTCSPLGQVSGWLRRAGFSVLADEAMTVHGDWDGGRDGQTILVTHAKVWGVVAYVDDKAANYQFGSSTSELWARIDDRPVPVLVTVFTVETDDIEYDRATVGIVASLAGAQRIGQAEADSYETGPLVWIKASDKNVWTAIARNDELTLTIHEVEVQA